MDDAPAEHSWLWLQRGFATTRWSLVKRAQRLPSGKATGAEEICRLYWHPLYAFLRARGHAEADAQDHVQSFMLRLIHDRLLEKPDKSRGRFRNFLLTVLLRHVASEKKHAGRQKRGGGRITVPLDWNCAETMRLADAANATSPEETFRRSLAVRLVDEALALLRRRYDGNGQAALFEELLPALEGPLVNDSFGKVALRQGMTEVAVRAAVFRLRERFRETLRATAASAWDMPLGPAVDAKLRDLFG